jgi:hypothetical protein
VNYAWPCADCGTDTAQSEIYMVHDHVWQTARGPDPGFLCIGCLENRLGRQLTAGDFEPVPVNDPASIWACHSERLVARLAAGRPPGWPQLPPAVGARVTRDAWWADNRPARAGTVVHPGELTREELVHLATAPYHRTPARFVRWDDGMLTCEHYF